MSTTFTNRTPITTSFTSRTPVTTSWDPRVDFLLKQDSFYLLLQNGYKIILRGVGSGDTDWTDRAEV